MKPKRAVFLLGFLSLALFAPPLERAKALDDEGATWPFLLVPSGLFERYFPQGARYTIPSDPKTTPLLERAREYEERKNWGAAAKAYALAYQRAQGSQAAPYIRFKESTLIEDVPLSMQELEGLILGYPSFPLVDAARFELAKRAYILGEYARAAGALEGILEHEGRGPGLFTPYVHSFLGELMYRQGRPEEAIRHYMASIEAVAGNGGLSDGAGSGKGTAVGPDRTDQFIVRNYLEASRSLLALGTDQALESVRFLLPKVAGSAELAIIREEAIALLGELSPADPAAAGGPGADETPVPVPDDDLLRGTYRITPGGAISTTAREGGLESPEANAGPPAGYSIQLGSFGKRANAERLASELKGKGYSPVIAEASVGGNTVFRVKVGPFATLREAEERSRELQGLGYRGLILSER